MALAIPSDPAAKQALDDGLKDAPAAVQTIRELIAAAEKEDKEVPTGFTLLEEAPTMRTRRSHRRRANSGGSRPRASLALTLSLARTRTRTRTRALTLTLILALTQVARVQRREPHPHRRRAQGAPPKP